MSGSGAWHRSSDSKSLQVEVVFPLTSHVLMGCFIIDEKMEGNPENKNSVTASGIVWSF